MRVFCTRCGAPNEVATAGRMVNCSSCGNQFLPARPPPKPGSGGATVALIVVAVLAVPCLLGVVAAVALPSYMRGSVRAKQSECKSTLKSMYTAQRAHFAERDRYTSLLDELGYRPDRGNLYAYFAGYEGTLEDRRGQSARSSPNDTGVTVDYATHPQAGAVDVDDVPSLAGGVQLGVAGSCPDCEVTMACAGNIDEDRTLDIWSVSTKDRTGPGGEGIAPGEPFNEVNDSSR
ncbi:MAG: fimbrial protein [Myxococcales bacterium]|nr:fimbrial protein [Myxococcales bacterium]